MLHLGFILIKISTSVFQIIPKCQSTVQQQIAKTYRILTKIQTSINSQRMRNNVLIVKSRGHVHNGMAQHLKANMYVATILQMIALREAPNFKLRWALM